MESMDTGSYWLQFNQEANRVGRYLDVLISMLASNVADRIYAPTVTYRGHQILFMLPYQGHGGCWSLKY